MHLIIVIKKIVIFFIFLVERQVFIGLGIKYYKVLCEGHVIPKARTVKR